MSYGATTFLDSDGALTRVAQDAAVLDASRRLPQGAYTTLRTHGGRGVVRLSQHVARLNETVDLLGSGAVAVTGDRAREALRQALSATAHPESRVRLTWAPPRLYVTVEPFEPLPEQLYTDGVRCVTLDVHRENPHAKDTRFIATASAAYGRLPSGVHEGLLLGDDGAILEGLSSNFFGIEGGMLRTEEARALLGVTRSLVLEVAAGLLPVERRAVLRTDLGRLSEAFLTSVSRGILPVVGIDAGSVADGRPGPATRELRRRFDELVARELEQL
jgi:branched-chain amino acid aminotransferase